MYVCGMGHMSLPAKKYCYVCVCIMGQTKVMYGYVMGTNDNSWQLSIATYMHIILCVIYGRWKFLPISINVCMCNKADDSSFPCTVPKFNSILSPFLE